MWPIAARVVRSILLIALLVGSLFVGSAVGVRYGVHREMGLYADFLAGRLPYLAECKRRGCDGAFERLIVQENDEAIARLMLLEQQMSESTVSVGFGLSILPLATTLADGWHVTSSDQFRFHYRQLGCGLDGVTCSSSVEQDKPGQTPNNP
jgi:hypothetical protein